MSRAHTLEERFIMALYEHAEGRVEGEGAPEDELAHAVGLSQRQLRAVCLQLAKANFIRRHGDGTVQLSECGERLALELLD